MFSTPITFFNSSTSGELPVKDPPIFYVPGETDTNDQGSLSLSINNTGVFLNQTFVKYGSNSMFASNQGRYLEATDPGLVIGTSDYTFELWLLRAIARSGELFSIRDSGVEEFRFDFPISTIEYGHVGSLNIYNGSVAVQQWSHFAAVREGTQARLYLNGILVDVGVDTHDYVGDTVRVGDPMRDWHIDSIRITKQAIYTRNFNPETETGLAY